ncbi:phosphate signaling complex protein PhoU [Thiomicrospira microaerophila]|uniref:phosphate signaling complex protein PhoU n=1 Tax=Thiomicrospira microaerophila TaxID=406020 RepID=UPI00200EB05A|nr:phosphate signaling complex protein PhoU [Thiomicrospira microaerophila]UQB43117.1 phosphate signaling complex protein PhoU [Thiomicrospira microaerophila]
MNRKEFSSHVSASYNLYLEDLFNQILEMGGLVERQLQTSVLSVQNADAELAKEVIQLDKLVNREEMEIDRLCVRVLARQQPTASDLRLIVSAIRIAVDLERMGDEIVKISGLVLRLADRGDLDCQNLQGYKQLVEISSRARDMLKNVLDAFTRLDLSGAAAVIEEEEHVDDLFAVAMEEVTERFKESHNDIECLLQLVYALRAAERITDHARNIAESVVYLVNGQDMRNMNDDLLADFLKSLTVN